MCFFIDGIFVSSTVTLSTPPPPPAPSPTGFTPAGFTPTGSTTGLRPLPDSSSPNTSSTQTFVPPSGATSLYSPDPSRIPANLITSAPTGTTSVIHPGGITNHRPGSDLTAFSSPISTGTTLEDPIVSPKSTSNSPPIGAIVGGTVGGVVVLCLILTLLIRRRRPFHSDESPDFTPISSDDSVPEMRNFIYVASGDNIPRTTKQSM
jgi:hypothetical protein